MAREDLLAQLQRQVLEKEGPPPPDDNVLIQKMVAPNDSTQLSDGDPVLTVLNPANFKWGGYQESAAMPGVVSQVYIQPGWKWGQGQYK